MDYKGSPPPSLTKKLKIYPKCLLRGLHYISAEGYYFPCCWMEDYKHFSFSHSEMQTLSLYKHSLKDIFKSSALKRVEESWKNISQAHKRCIQICSGKDSQKNKANSAHEKIYT